MEAAIFTNPAYGVGTDGVAVLVSTNPAYGVSADGVTNPAYGVGVAVSTNPAYGLATDGVSTNPTYYNVNMAEEKLDNEYDYIIP